MTAQEILTGIVDDAGYIAAADGKNVAFNVEGIGHRFEFFGEDSSYARLIVGFGTPAEVGIDALQSAANAQNRTTKSVKTVVYPAPDEGFVCFSIEMFFADALIWGPVLERSIAALRDTSDAYFAALKQGTTVAA